MSTASSYAEYDHTIRLGDGRHLRYLDLGDPAGLPVVSCHGGLSSRLDILPAADVAMEKGVRLLAPDRPGVGGSDRQPDRTLLDWPSDVVELTEQLEVTSAAVMGWSLGAPYAMACAWALPRQVSALAVIASTIPPTWTGANDEIDRLDRVLLRLSGKHPHLERSIFHLLHATAKHAPGLLAKQSGLTGSTADAVTTAIAEGLLDTDGMADEYRVFDSPWGFDPSDLSTPVQIWQGTADELVPEQWGHRLAAEMPNATLHLVEGGNHFLWYDHWADIFDSLLSAARPERP